ncbi:MAG: dienelactone hydrolase family protein [Candidatus Binatia bacterium]
MANQLIRETRVNLQLDEVTLEGHLVTPEDPRGMVIFAHGSGSSRHSPRNRSVAKRLNEARLATLLFDLLTEGEQVTDQASGRFRFDILLLARRLSDTVDSVIRRWETAGMKIGLFGASTGAAEALITAAERIKEVAAVVSRGGRPDLAWESLPQVMAPTLLIVGEMDPAVIELNQRAYAQLQTEKRLDIVRGATHLFEEPGALDAVADLAAQWFVHHLTPKDVRPAPTIEADRRKDMELPNKREMIQAIIDDEPEPWIIMKPSRQDPTDPESLCIFENPAEQTQARAEIPLLWFQNRELGKIKEAVQQGLRHAETKI